PLPGRPHVLVIVPAFNCDAFIGDAVRSIRASTTGDWSCVVVDDGSTDETFARAEAAAEGDPRFTLVSQANAGHIGAINRACDAPGDVVALLDSDDLFLPDKLTVALRILAERPTAGLLVHRLFVTDVHGRIIGLMPLA